MAQSFVRTVSGRVVVFIIACLRQRLACACADGGAARRFCWRQGRMQKAYHRYPLLAL